MRNKEFNRNLLLLLDLKKFAKKSFDRKSKVQTRNETFKSSLLLYVFLP